MKTINNVTNYKFMKEASKKFNTVIKLFSLKLFSILNIEDTIKNSFKKDHNIIWIFNIVKCV